MSTVHSITRLYGLGLTPGKLRGLQRISNPNGTLTMVATDQNSSMISMMKKAMKDAGKSEPTYAEIADAKVMLSRALAPHCSGLLVDGYYGYASTVAAFAVPASTGLLDPRREVGRDQEHGRRAVRRSRAGLGRRARSSAAAPTRSSCSPSSSRTSSTRPRRTSSSPARFTTSASSTTSSSCWSRSTSPTTAKTTKSREQDRKRKAQTVIDSAEVPEPLLRRVQGRVPRHARRRDRLATHGQPEEAERRVREAVGAALGRRRLRQVQEAGRDGDEGRRERRARRPGVLEGVLHLHDAGRAAEVRRDRVRHARARKPTRS